MDSTGTGLPDLDRDEEIVQVEGHPSGTSADISISCSDATGLGCDIARVIFNFGLTVYSGDFSTDGRWCFVMLQVRPCFASGNPPCATNWNLLKRHLLRICLNEKTMRKKGGNKMFILQLQFQDQIGTLHNIIHCLWEANLVVHKANISTSPDNKGLDVFYVSDKLDKLPKPSRVNQIRAIVENNIKGNSELKLNCLAVPTLSTKNSVRLLTGTRECKDSRSSLPLMKTLSNRDRRCSSAGSETGSGRSSSASESLEMLPKFNITEILETLKVDADNLVSSTHTVLHVECPDRKGLMYDLFRITKDVGLQISYSKISLDNECKLCRADLFVNECEFQQKLTDEMIEFLCAEIKNAITSSILVKVQNKTQDTGMGGPKAILQTEVLAVAPVDSGFRGRPRVLYDLTATFHELGVSIFHAEMYTVEIPGNPNVLNPADKRYQEVHRFVIQGRNGKPIVSGEDLKEIESKLYSRLIGNRGENVSKMQFAKLANLLDFGCL